MNNYENIKLDKTLYRNNNFSSQLERLDPSHNYQNSDLANLDAFQRQLKRFDIKVSGPKSDSLEKFFASSDATTLFPEYLTRAVNGGVDNNDILSLISAAKTNIDAMDYRSITTDLLSTDTTLASPVDEATNIPVTNIRLKDTLVTLKKYGRVLAASYESVRQQRIELFTVALKQIGAYIAKAQLKAAVDVLINGDTTAEIVRSAAPNALTYNDLLALWRAFDDFEMNVILASPVMISKIMAIPELKDPINGIHFIGTGTLSTPLGANLIKCSDIDDNTIVAIDKRFALETITCGGILTQADKLIDKQLERTAVTSICGFNKLFPEAVKVLSLATA